MNGRPLTAIERDALANRLQTRAKELVELKAKANVPFIKDYDIGLKHHRYFNEQEKMTLLENILIEGMMEGCKVLQRFRDEINSLPLA